MAARRNKNGQFSKRAPRRRARAPARAPTRRRRKQATSVIAVGTQVAVANAITMGLFNSNIGDFLTGRLDGNYKAGADGGHRLTLPEILGAGAIAFGGTYASPGKNPMRGYENFGNAVMTNFWKNLPMMGAQVIGIPIGVRMAKKFLAKPIINPTNKMIRKVGISEVKL